MHTQRRWRRGAFGGPAVGVALAALLGLALTTAVLSAAEAGGGVDLGVGWEEYADGFTEPVDIASTGIATDTRLFVVERDGRIKVVDNGTVLPTLFLNIDSQVSGEAHGEMGLLGLAFDPDFANNQHFYVYYTDNSSNLQLSRYQVSADPNVALTTEVKLLNIPHPSAGNHNGGDLNFGPDGYLYLAPGDGADRDNAPDLGSLLGKLLRIDVSGQTTYTVPADNPFTQIVGARPEIWAVGFRNPWRFSFDRVTGDLYIGDVGEVDWEEISRQPAASAGGEHYGWPCYEGGQADDDQGGCPPANELTMPIFDYSHPPGVAVTGGYVYRGAAYPALRGYYFFADYGSRHFWALHTGTDAVTALGQLLTLGANPSTFGEDPVGELYVADLGSDPGEGVIYKLTGPEPVAFLPLMTR